MSSRYLPDASQTAETEPKTDKVARWSQYWVRRFREDAARPVEGRGSNDKPARFSGAS